MKSSNAKEKLLLAAAELFYQQGITNTGIDAIISRAGVAKMSLYNNFSSKSALVAAYLDHRHELWLALYHKRLAQANSPQEAVLSVFDAYQEHADIEFQQGFRGCGLLNAAAEMPNGSPERLVVKRHKEEVATLVELQLRNFLPRVTHPPRITQLSQHLCFLLEGAISLAGLEGQSHKLQEARQMAAQLLEQNQCQ
jgi:AcrR family transcriptional regulator